MKTKLIALLLLCAMSLSAFAACGGDNGSEGESSESKKEEVSSSAESTGETAESTEESTSEADTSEEETTEADPVVPDYLMLYVDSDVKLIDDASTNENGGGSGYAIQYVDGSGVGYSSLNDIVYFENVDFGEKGAKAMTIAFSNGNKKGTHTTLAVYIDDYQNTEPVCTFDIKYTGGWDVGYAKDFTVDCVVPSGTHTVYIQYTNENSGSFAKVSFAEAE